MKFYSTTNKSLKVDLKEAVLKGIAGDGGLFLPERITPLPENFFKEIDRFSLQEIAATVTSALLQESISQEDIKKIVANAINFPAPLVKLSDKIYSLELFHGPTMAFKDFGARFLAQLTSFLLSTGEKITILVATSGDTGSAVASAFFNIPAIRVLILYPSGKISPTQEQQFTTLGGNISAFEVSGVFDDCQRLVKQAFSDNELSALRLTPANSINIARLIPQTFYYFYGYARLLELHKKTTGQALRPVFSVPSGNFGNLTAGIMAQKMGLPVKKFIASVNANDIFPAYLDSGKFQPKPSRPTLSNSMDVGNPSNVFRLFDLYEKSLYGIKKDIDSFSFSDEETKGALNEIFNTYGYISEPHGAVAYLGLKRYLADNPEETGIFLGTAHPAKFHEAVEPVIGQQITFPPALSSCLKKEKLSIKISADYLSFKNRLRNDF